MKDQQITNASSYHTSDQTDILLNGILLGCGKFRDCFQKEDVSKETFIIQTIADITDDKNGSVPY